MSNASPQFVIRFWREAGGQQAPGEWRGCAKHVQSDGVYYFSSLVELREFILRHLGGSA